MAGQAVFNFKDKGIKTLLDKIRKNTKSIEKKDKDFAKIVWTHVFADVIRHFEQEKGPRGKWKQLHPLTLENRKGGSGKILQDTGNMRQSFKPFPYKKTSNEMVFFNFASYSKVHDEGGFSKIGKQKITVPKRKFMYLSKKAMDALSVDVAKFMEGGK